MKKKYLMSGLAVLALSLTIAGCSKESGLGESDYVGNAEKVFGVQIDPNHDWNMTTALELNVTVNWGSAKTYTVYVFDKSPFDNNDAVYLKKTEITDGTVLPLELSVPSYLTELYVSVFDSNNRSISKKAKINGNTAYAVFGTALPNSYTFTRGQYNPEVNGIPAPYDEAWVAEYLETAKEPNSDNISDNYDNSYYVDPVEASEGTFVKTHDEWVIDVPGHNETVTETVWVDGTPAVLGETNDRYLGTWTQDDWNYYNNLMSPLWSNWDNDKYQEVLRQFLADGHTAWVYVVTPGTEGSYQEVTKTVWVPEQGHYEERGYWTGATEGHEGYWVYDETFVLNFKITGTWNGGIGVVATEGLTDGVANGNERTVVVTGTWNITEGQRVGSKGRIIIANGGTVNIAAGVTLNMVNQARLVVLPGGPLTGAGAVEVNNGTAEGEENYNAGTIDVATFNNNFGKFYNYGKFLVNEYEAGATESNFYNHSLVSIDHTGTTPNARVFNACQFYVQNDARLRNYEGVNGSALIVGGQFMPFGSEDGTSIPSFVSLAAGALVKCGSLYNGSSWIGPTEGGYAALEIVNQIDYLNWVQDSPQTAGYFANNIYVKCGDWQNDPGGQGYHQDDPSDFYNYSVSRAEYKFFQIAANSTGNGNVKKVEDGDNYYIDPDSDFDLGNSGCTPGFKMTEPEDDDDDDNKEEIHENEPEDIKPIVYTYAFEDTFMGDYDMNDVVLQVWEEDERVYVKLCCTGASYDLYVYLGNVVLFGGREVHAVLGGTAGKFINTGSGSDKFETCSTYTTDIAKPYGFDVATADFWIYSPAGEIHVGTTENTRQIGHAPYGLRIPGEWKWPMEWTPVNEAYEYFSGYAANRYTNTDWYDYPTSGKTYN